MYTDAKKVEIIAFIVDTQSAHQNDEDGDKYLSSANYAMEAIEAVINETDSSILRMFLGSGTEATS